MPAPSPLSLAGMDAMSVRLTTASLFAIAMLDLWNVSLIEFQT